MRKLLVLLAVGALLGTLAVTAFGATRTVKIGDNWFVRASGSHSAVIAKGSTVKWVWTGRRPHNVTKTGGPGRGFHSTTKSSGSYRHTFRRRGLYTIVCTIHPGMEMKLRVK